MPLSSGIGSQCPRTLDRNATNTGAWSGINCSLTRFKAKQPNGRLRSLPVRIQTQVAVTSGKTSLCIQVVDADIEVRKSLKSLFRGTAIDFYSYAGAEEFLNRGATRTGCVLIELCLGGMNGIALQKELIKLGSAITVIMLSSCGSLNYAVAAMRLGAADFFTKPFDPERLRARTLDLLNADQDEDAVRRTRAKRIGLVDTLTPREEQVLRLIVDGLRTKKMAEMLTISPRTVEAHRSNIMQKLGAESLADLVRIWMFSRTKTYNAAKVISG